MKSIGMVCNVVEDNSTQSNITRGEVKNIQNVRISAMTFFFKSIRLKKADNCRTYLGNIKNLI